MRRRLAVIAAAVVLSPLVAELTVRAALGDPVVLHREAGHLYDPAPAPLRVVLSPGGTSTVTYHRRSGEVLREVTMRVNARGFRGPLPRSGRPRIVCIGDSHTFGYGVGEADPWPRVLEEVLRTGAYAEAEVLNLGVGGYGPERERVRLERDGLPLDPDLVLWQWFINDLESGPSAAARPSAVLRLAHWSSPWRTGTLARARRTSRLVDLALHELHFWTRRAASDLNARAEAVADLPAYRTLLESLEAARRATEARGASFVVVVFPLLVRGKGEYLSAPLDRVVIAWCQAEGIACVDLSGAFDALPQSRLTNTLLDYHASAEAHRCAGHAIAAELLRHPEWLR